MWFGQTFEGMLQECQGEKDTASQTERKQIRLMQKVFGESYAPKLQYASMKQHLMDRGAGPGQTMKSSGNGQVDNQGRTATDRFNLDKIG